MAERSDILTDLKVEKAKPSEKVYYLRDKEVQGLYLVVYPTGTKAWILRQWQDGKERRSGLGGYPDTKIAAARKAARKARGLLQDEKIAPADKKRADRAARMAVENAEAIAAASTFEVVARACHAQLPSSRNEKHLAQWISTLEKWAFPSIGPLPLREIKPTVILGSVLRPILEFVNEEGLPDPKIETADRVFQRISAVYSFAAIDDETLADPTRRIRAAFRDLKESVLHHKPPANFPAVDRDELGPLLKKIETYGSRQTVLALKLIAYTAVRSGELRRAEWKEFDLDSRNPTWRIPKLHMKAKIEHHVPLSTQAVAIIKELQDYAANSDLVVPSARDREKPISDMTLSKAINSMGYKDRQSVHGFRSCFSTIVNETMHYRPAAVEKQLAHGLVEGGPTAAAYNRANYMDERREMMQAYADLLDALRDGGGKVIPIGKAAKRG